MKADRQEAIRNTDEPTVAVLDVDQAELTLNPTRTRVWAPVGVPWEVETPATTRKQTVFGAVNSRSGQTHFQLSAHKRSLDFQHVRRSADRLRLPGGGPALSDRGRSQHYKSKSTRAWLKERPQIVLAPLPSYAPKLNLQGQI